MKRGRERGKKDLRQGKKEDVEEQGVKGGRGYLLQAGFAGWRIANVDEEEKVL